MQRRDGSVQTTPQGRANVQAVSPSILGVRFVANVACQSACMRVVGCATDQQWALVRNVNK